MKEINMRRKQSRYNLLFIILAFHCLQLFSQEKSVLEFVNPMIGTTNTKMASRWGSEGGTYPGAVAPFGLVQLSPETRITNSKGYNFADSTIFFFTCVSHLSGYPSGSSGMIKVMPLGDESKTEPGEYFRSFNHQNEIADPGYYRVKFSDDGTIVEATASGRTGMFRFTFPPKCKPRIYLGDLGHIEIVSKRTVQGSAFNSILSFNADFIRKEDISGGCILTFPAAKSGKNELILKLGVSLVDSKSTQQNVAVEAETWNFDQFRAGNQKKWVDALSVIEIEDTSVTNKTIFYTALYHSMLLPWVISDVNGMYKGADGKIHKTNGKNQYSGFSPWDTFRSLHPLLCLIAPDRQNDMILSMLDHFEQCGELPKGPMTGNHIIAIIVDSYLKGINNFSPSVAFKAMQTSLNSSSKTEDFAAYNELGFVPFSLSESVTKTVEYAYDDWALAQFAGKVMNDQSEFLRLQKRSFSYRNLFYPEALALLPRNDNHFIPEPSNSGYKEGDKWSYSMFVPHNPKDLINLMGGDLEFTSNLDSALTSQKIMFDNEPVLHVPYLFNYASHPENTQKWVRKIMKTHYTNSADGLPGNDDLGSLSSWYVFSALGFFPTCPGQPNYDLGSPIFKKATIHLQDGKSIVINSENNSDDHVFVSGLKLNGKEYQKSWISHSSILQGGELTFTMDKIPATFQSFGSDYAAPSETTASPDFHLSDFYSNLKQVLPDQSFFVHFKLENKGSKGTKIVRLLVDRNEYGRKNLLVDENSVVNDSLECKLYPIGKRILRIDDRHELEIEVISPPNKQKSTIEVISLESAFIGKKDEALYFSYKLQNKGGIREKINISVMADDTVSEQKSFELNAGEIVQVASKLVFKRAGFHRLTVGSKSKTIKMFSENTGSKVLDISADSRSGDILTDHSGFLNHGFIRRKGGFSREIETGSDCFIEFENSESLDQLSGKITVMAWIKPSERNSELADIITKGDFIALQEAGNKTLSFFAGGWGRGSCDVLLPENWVNTWHHIAGVSDGNSLKVFIDGRESGRLNIGTPVNLSSKAKWMIGRNEEFPEQRYFHGFVDHVKIFTEALNALEIKQEMQNGRPDQTN
jgi:putative alpha-1,2-mannosidase